MKFELRRVGPDFALRAGRTYTVECDLKAPRRAVWGAIRDATTWNEWFPGVERAWYQGDGPYGVGSIREAIVGGFHFEEELVVWDEDVRWGYCITSCTAPLARAQFECHELEDRGDGTRVRWVVASDRRLLLWLATPVMSGLLRLLHRRAMTNLEAWLREKGEI